MNNRFWGQLSVFIVVFIGILLLREYALHQLLMNDVHSYAAHTTVEIIANGLLFMLAFILIQENRLCTIAGLSHKGVERSKIEKGYLLLFPLIYLVGLNLLISDELSQGLNFINISLLALYCLSIGFAEEFTIRGFLQSFLIKKLGRNKKGTLSAVFLAALFFGLVHLIKFDSGVYGELAQLAFATFIGLMFGMLLLLTKRLYPLVIIHALIDFFADLDSAGLPIEHSSPQVGTLENALLIILLTSPCLIYALFLMLRYKTTAP